MYDQTQTKEELNELTRILSIYESEIANLSGQLDSIELQQCSRAMRKVRNQIVNELQRSCDLMRKLRIMCGENGEK